MTTLSFGYLQPAPGDTGDIFYSALQTDISQLNGHNHDGVTSAPLSSQQVNLSPSWIAAPIGGGLYYQVVTVPSGLSYDTCQTWFKLTTGEPFYPSLIRNSSSSFNVYANDPSLMGVAYFR